MENNRFLLMLLLPFFGLISIWPAALVNIHPEEPRALFDLENQLWLLTVSEELYTGIIVSLFIIGFYGYYWLKLARVKQ